MPRRPGMPKVMEAQIAQARLAYRVLPGCVRQLVTNRPAAKRKAKLLLLFALAFQHSDRIAIQRDASWRSILGLVQPGGPAVQVHPLPFQAILALPALLRDCAAGSLGCGSPVNRDRYSGVKRYT